MTLRHGLLIALVIILNCAVLASAAPTYSMSMAKVQNLTDGNYTFVSVFWNSTTPLSTAVLSTNETGVWVNYSKPVEYSEEMVPILYYHQISDTDTSPYTTKVSDFRDQMDYLYKNNYNTITFTELLEYMNNGTKLPEKSIILTFDDGWKDQYDNAFPLLKKYGFTATFFIITNVTINNNYYPGYMGVADVQALHAAGMEIGCHSKTHPLGGLVNESADLNIEINESKNDIYSWLGVYPKTFAYPEGVYNDTIMEWVKENGFIGARAIEKDGMEEGWIDPRFAWLRASNDEDSKFTIGSNIIDSNTTLNGTSYSESFEKLVNYTKKNEFEDTYVTLVDAGINGNITLEDQYDNDSFSSINLPDIGDAVSVGVLIPSDDDYNVTFRVLTGGFNATDSTDYNAENNIYSYYIDGVLISHEIVADYVNDTHIINDADNVTVWGFVWGSHKIWNRHMAAGFHNITVVMGTDWNMLDYFSIDYSSKVIDASKYYNSPRFPRNYEAWTNFTWRNDSVPYGTAVGLRVYANDTSGNTTATDILSFIVGGAMPISYSNNQSQTVSTYTPTGYSNFSITLLTDFASATAYLENNFTGNMTNVTMNGTYPDFYYNSSVLAAGTYQYRFIGNDTGGNLISTDLMNFTIGKADNLLDLYFNNGTEIVNQNLTVTYSTQTNVTGICTKGNCTLYRNGNLTSENNTNMILGAGLWEYVLFATETQNYTGNSTSYNITVEKGVLGMSIGFDPSTTVDSGQQSIVTGFENNIGDDDVNYTLWRDDTLVSDTYPYEEAATLELGTYIYTFNATDGENWTTNSVSGPLTVQKPAVIYLGGGGGGGSYTPPVTEEEDNTTEETPEPDYLDETIQDVVQEQNEICSEDWMCLEWSECINSTQERVCIDINNCGTEDEKPEVSQECEEQNFITGMFSFVTTPVGLGIMALISMVVIFVVLPIREKLKF